MKKHLIRNLAAMAVIVCFAFALPETETQKINVVIDAGHGGKDFGAKHDDFLEKDIVASIAQKVKELNDDKEVVIHFTRNEDEFQQLTDRVETINNIKPDLVLSLHINMANKSDKSGMEFYIGQDVAQNQKSKEYAAKLSNVMSDRFEVAPVKEARFYILKNTEAPGVLFEMGFLSNENDRQYLTSQNGQKEIASRIVNFLKEIE